MLSLLLYPPAITWWLLVHPFVGLWRKLGTVSAFVILTVYSLIVIAALYGVRGALLAVEFGADRRLWALVVLFYGASLYVEVRARKHLKFRVLAGVPELAPRESGGRLLTEGIYGRIRHPRYVGVILGIFALAFFTNYLAVYVIAVSAIPALYLVVLLEERELLDRFGDEYASYASRVPRFFPRLRRREVPGSQGGSS